MSRTKYLPLDNNYFFNKRHISWHEVFRNGVQCRLETVISGYLSCKIDRLINIRHPACSDLKPGYVKIPVPFYIFTHPFFGNFLIDAGLDSSYQTNPMGRTKGLLAKKIMPWGIQQEHQNAAVCLKNRNMQPAGVFLSHLHMDHMAGIIDLPEDTRIYINRGERPTEVFPLVYDDYLHNISEILEIDMDNGRAIPPFRKCVDIFGDGSLWIISTPGHTRYHVSFIINIKGDPHFITADACHMDLNMKKEIGPGAFSYNVRLAQETLEKVVEFSRTFPKVKILYGHNCRDFTVMEKPAI